MSAKKERLRLDRLMSAAGIPRSEAKRLVAAGRVTAGGVTARDPGDKYPATVEIAVDGKILETAAGIYLMINKPAGVVTATEDAHFETVLDLVPEKYARRGLGPVGRLDRDVTGLVLLTDDGELAHRLISPKCNVEKIYRAVCEGKLGDGEISVFAEGIRLSDHQCRPAILRILSSGEDRSEAEVTITEGKFHQVKRMFAAAGHPLISLRRLSIGGVCLDETLPEGAFRPLSEQETAQLKSIAYGGGE